MSGTESQFGDNGSYLRHLDDPRYFVPRTLVREAWMGRDEAYRPWEAPPLLAGTRAPEQKNDSPELAAQREVQFHQDDVRRMYMELLETEDVVDGLPPATIKAVAAHILPQGGRDLVDYQGNHERSVMLLPDFELGEADRAIHGKVDIGTATMAEIKSDFEKVGRGSGELAILGIINGFRGEHYDPMMDELRALLGSHYSDGGPRKFRVLGLDDHYLRGERMKSITWGFKQHYGTLPDGTEVDSRHTFVLRTDKAAKFNQSIRAVMQNAAQHEESHAVQVTRVKDVLDEVAQAGPTHPQVAAATVKLYLYNHNNDELIAQRDAETNRRRANEAAFDSSRMSYRNPQNPEDRGF